jgi:hypothetical protein
LRLVLTVKEDRIWLTFLLLLHLGQAGLFLSCSETVVVTENFLLQAAHRYS